MQINRVITIPYCPHNSIATLLYLGIGLHVKDVGMQADILPTSNTNY